LWIDSITLKGMNMWLCMFHGILTCLVWNEMIYELVGWWWIWMSWDNMSNMVW